MNIENLVVNWHITENCNYHCKFCFAKWGKQYEIWNNFDNTKKVIDNLRFIWQPSYRLNLVGGEPLLFPEKIIPVIEYASNSGMKLSIQTNGTNLEFLSPVIDSISQIGISVDSWNENINRNIGRCSGNKTLSFKDLKNKIENLRKVNKNFKLKINTVVNEWNWNDIVIPKMKELAPSRIKIFKQMPFGNSKGISQEQFYTFIRNNYDSKLPIFVEDNEIMTESYLMIAPDGRLFQNGSLNYIYSDTLLNIDFLNALKKINIDCEKFSNRYKTDKTKEIVAAAFSDEDVV